MSTWSWTPTAADGAPVPEPEGGPQQPTGGFPVQADAETWVGESWRALLAVGVEHVVLLRDGERVYGPLALRPPG